MRGEAPAAEVEAPVRLAARGGVGLGGVGLGAAHRGQDGQGGGGGERLAAGEAGHDGPSVMVCAGEVGAARAPAITGPWAARPGA